MRIIDVENWDERIELDRDVFEEYLSINYDLQLAYVELYSTTAQFFSLTLGMKEDFYGFYCMTDIGRVNLIFYRLK